MILQTNLLGLLSARGFKISLISPDAKDPVLVTYCKAHDIELHHFHSSKWIWRSPYILYRTYFLEDIKANPALYEKHYYETHRAKHRWKILKFIPYILICFYYLFQLIPSLRKVFKKIENQFLKSRKANQLLSNINADLVISTYPVSPQEGILLFEANRLRLHTVIHLLSWDNITSKGHFFSMADHYIAWGPVMKSEFMEKYKIPESDIYSCGVPHFDLHKVSKIKKDSGSILTELGLNAEHPFFVIGMSAPRFVPKELEIVEFLASEINSNKFGNQMQFVIRPHPQNVKGWMADPDWMNRIQKLENSRIKIFYPQLAESKLQWSMELADMHKLSDLLACCVVCINSCSTLSIDTLVAGKGNIAPMFDAGSSLPYWGSARRLLDYTHIKKFVALGGTLVVTNFDNLIREINNFESNKSYRINESQHALEAECISSMQDYTLNVIDSIEILSTISKVK
jgi:hypothetical protein